MALDNKKKYIILTGSEGGYGNLGDEWLLESVKKQYVDIKKQYNVVILIANPPKKQKDGFIYIKDSLDSFISSDICINDIESVHYYGGGYLNQIWMNDKIWLFNYLISNGFSPKKVIFTGAGLGPFDDLNLKNMKIIADKVAIFCTRDNYYKKQISSSLSFDESVIFCDCEDKTEALKRRNEVWVNFRIADHAGLDKGAIDKISYSIEEFAKEKKLKVIYFSMVEGKCLREKKLIKEALKKRGIKHKIFNRAKNHKILMSRLSRAKLVITSSYHASLAGIYVKTPVVSVYENDYYSIKFNGLIDVLDTKLLTITNINDFSVDVLRKAFNIKDILISKKLLRLKSLNEDIYNKYRRLLND